MLIHDSKSAIKYACFSNLNWNLNLKVTGNTLRIVLLKFFQNVLKSDNPRWVSMKVNSSEDVDASHVMSFFDVWWRDDCLPGKLIIAVWCTADRTVLCSLKVLCGVLDLWQHFGTLFLYWSQGSYTFSISKCHTFPDSHFHTFLKIFQTIFNFRVQIVSLWKLTLPTVAVQSSLLNISAKRRR